MSKQADPPKEKPRSITINFSDNDPEKETPREPKQSHICIFGDCKKGKRGGTDYCRTHKPISEKQTYGTSTKKAYNKSTKKNSTKSTKTNSNDENTIVLPDNLNQNRSTKALFGFAMIALGVLAIVTPSAPRERCFFCVFFLISSCIGVSLILQSIPKKNLSFWDVIIYTIISILIVLFGFIFLIVAIFSLWWLDV